MHVTLVFLNFSFYVTTWNWILCSITFSKYLCFQYRNLKKELRCNLHGTSFILFSLHSTSFDKYISCVVTTTANMLNVSSFLCHFSTFHQNVSPLAFVITSWLHLQVLENTDQFPFYQCCHFPECQINWIIQYIASFFQIY